LSEDFTQLKKEITTKSNMPNLLSKSKPKLFNLLSIGQRGVGKTVFLAGSYVELHSGNLPKLWFECQNSQAKENIESILNYIARTGQYPPPTMKVAEFNFVLKRRRFWGIETPCYFRWWDIPGEDCKIDNPNFQKMVLSSHGCCFFINAYNLLENPSYLKSLSSAIEQAVAIASLAHQNRLNYPLALIFTQCDRLESLPVGRLKIEEKIRSLLDRLDALKAPYERFYSAIPIISNNNTFSLKAKGAAIPLLWLTSHLNAVDRAPSKQNLGTLLNRDIVLSNLQPPTTERNYILILILASAALLGVIASLLFFFQPSIPNNSGTLTSEQNSKNYKEQKIEDYELILQKDPNNFETLVNLANLYLENAQIDRAIPLIEKISRQKPDNLDWQFNLAQLYELKNDKEKAEEIYDRILAQHQNNFKALINKAVLRGERGDFATAKSLFDRAEKTAPNDELKAKVRDLSRTVIPPKR
jgi:tetratricopeptide (TPR) repeat protein